VANESTTKCIRCGRETSGEAPALCEQCKAEGYAICANCGKRVSNGTTPYCNICAEEIVGTG
jgi:DNA-directed RNA polymerase subunit RPC12/RpoP